MATGSTVIPINEERLSDEGFAEWLENDGLFFQMTVPDGRYPTPIELRQSIAELGYEVKEAMDWIVTSADDYTEVWFQGNKEIEDQPVEFSFLRGGPIVLNIAQRVAERCGSLIVINHSDGMPVVIVPDSVFPISSQDEASTFFDLIALRMPTMIDRLAKAKTNDALFILFQIRQALRKAQQFRYTALTQVAQQGLPAYMRLIRHGDTRVRHLAFELVALFRERTHERLKTLQRVIARERSSDTKTRMIEAIDPLVVPRWIGAGITRPVKAVLDLLEKLSEGTREAPSVRLAAAILLARAQPGFLNTAMRHIFTDALVRPDEYATSWNSPSTVVTRVLESLEYLMLNPRIEILMAALPDMDIAEDSHQAARYLLDYAFFGSKRGTSTTSLPDDHPAERPEIDESRLRNRRRSFGSLYPANPTRLTAADLTLTQREVLTLAISLDTPWMVHSNLLERYGLPPTRSAVRDLSELS